MCGFGHRIRRLCLDGQPNGQDGMRFHQKIGLVWTGPYASFPHTHVARAERERRSREKPGAGGQDCVEEQMFFNMSCCSLWSSSVWPGWRSSFSGQVLKAPEFFLGPRATDVSRYFEPLWTNAAVLAGPQPLAHLHAIL
ncbi:unnamed protein product [Boreogadus saida]